MRPMFSLLDDSRVDEAFAVLTTVGQWLESQGRRQRISKTTHETYESWQSKSANHVVTIENQIVGLVTLSFEELTDWPEFLSLGSVPMIRALATDPEFQRNGIAAFAVREVISVATENSRNDAFIYLDCVSDSLPEFYAKHGFIPIGDRIKTYPDGESFDITLMRRELNEA